MSSKCRWEKWMMEDCDWLGREYWWRSCYAPSVLIKEVVLDSDMVSKIQLWFLTSIKKLLKSDICIFLWKYFSRQIYSYNFYIFKLNNLKVIHDLYSQGLTWTLSQTTSFTSTEGVFQNKSWGLKVIIFWDGGSIIFKHHAIMLDYL